MRGIAIVIVTHNSEEVILPCLDGCLPYGSEVIVVDNASTDGTVQKVRKRPAVHLIVNCENRGFAAAVNQGVLCTRLPLVLLLNPDTMLTSGVGPLSVACSREDVGAAGGRLTGSDGEFQKGFSIRRLPTPVVLSFEALGINRIWPGNPSNRHYRYLDYDSSVAGDVEQPAGAFLMMKRQAWEAVDGLDEGFHPIWFEDVDFCKRLLEKGFRIRYEPGAKAVHVGGHSAKKLEWGTRQCYWYASLLRYASKHFGAGAARTVSISVASGACIRLVMGILRHGPRAVPVWFRIIRLACGYLKEPLRDHAIHTSSTRLIDPAEIHVL